MVLRTGLLREIWNKAFHKLVLLLPLSWSSPHAMCKHPGSVDLIENSSYEHRVTI
jgi:hypothetical protein